MIKGKLTAAGIKSIEKPGLIGDGNGLYLEARKGSTGVTKSWIFRYGAGEGGKTRYHGLGRYPDVSLAEARQKVAELRAGLLNGIDPIDAKHAKRAAAQSEAAKAMTFDQCAVAYIAAHRASWRNAVHAGQWKTTLAVYASPVFGHLPVAAIDTNLVLKAIEPIWPTKTETASRLRARIENILDWAKARGLRDGENPARWRGHIAKLLPVRSRVRKVKNHRALPFDELPAFLAELRQRQGITPKAFEFLILTAARTDEVLGARWSEFDLQAKVWSVPCERMKGGREHRVPLTPAALAILAGMAAVRVNDFVFPGRTGAGLSSSSLAICLNHTMGRADITTHGFRATFKTWAGERTGFPRELAEVALAHRIGDETERAYQRGDLLEKRRKLMDAWATFANKPVPLGDVVVTLRGQGAA
jgi:integrase